MDIARVGGRVELSMPADLVRRRGAFLAGFGGLALALFAVLYALGRMPIIVIVIALFGFVCVPIGLYQVVYASRISNQRNVVFDRERQTVVGARGARTVLFRAIDYLTVTRTAQIHALELVLRNGTTWRLHAESTQNPRGCDGMADAATQIAEATGLTLR